MSNNFAVNQDEVLARLAEKYKEAEARMMQNFTEEMFGPPGPPPTEADIKRWKREVFIRRLWAPWYFVKCRVLGIINVLRFGECRDCEIPEDYY